MALEDIKQCCLLLDSNRVTDRKKGCDRLQHLLNNSNIVSHLDTRPSDSFNWDQVFFSVKKYFLKECQKLEEEERKKPDASQTILKSRANQKCCAAALPKLVLKKSSLKTPHVAAHHVLDLVLTVLNRSRPYLLENFAGDVIQITQNYLLRFPQYHLVVPVENWKDLMRTCIWVYDNNLPSTDARTTVSVMEGIIKCCKMRGIQHQDFVPTKVLRPMPSFLKRALANKKLTSHHNLQSSLLKLLLTFTKAMGSEWRYLVCSVGEETLNSVLTMWESCPSARQTHWLEYINLQILIHCPQKDGKMSEESTFIHDSPRWQQCLHHIYQLLVDHLDEIALKNKVTQGSSLNAKPYTIPPLLVTLIARLCHKIFEDAKGYGVLDVTQLSSIQTSGTVGNRPNKRRKIEVGLQPLACMLREQGMELHTIPWYQILHEMLKSYTAFFDQARCSLMLELFTHNLSECRKPTIQEHIIRCLEALAHQYNRIYPQNDTEHELRMGKWTPAWDLTLRLVSGKQCTQSGLELLQSLMETGLVSPTSSVFKLFYQGYVDMNETALSTLLVVFSLVPLPKYFKIESAVLLEDQVKEARINLLHMLLPVYYEGCGVTGSMVSVASLQSPSLLAQILLLLKHRDPRFAQNERKTLIEHKQKISSTQKNSGFLTRLEESYRLATFLCDLPKSQHIGNDSIQLQANFKEVKSLQKEEQQILERVITFIDQVNNEDLLITSSGRQVLLQVTELIINMLLHFSDQRLEVKLKLVLELVTSGIKKICPEPGIYNWQDLLHILEYLHYLYTFVGSWTELSQNPAAKSNGQKVQEVLLSYTPPSLLTLILDLVRARTEKLMNNVQPGVSQTNTTQRNSMSRGNSSDTLDLDFDDFDGSPMETVDDFDLEAEQSSSISNENTDEQIIIEDVSSFSLQNQCIVMALQWLVVASESSGTAHESDDNATLLKVINLFLDSSQCYNLVTADVAVILKFVRTLFSAKYEEENIQDGFEILSNLCKNHASEYQVATCVLKTIAGLISVNGTRLSAALQGNVVKLTRAFAQKHQQGNYGQSVSEAIFALNVELSKVDPKRMWSRYIMSENDRCGEVYDLLCSPSHELRMMSASSIHELLVKTDGTLMDSQHQDKIFREVYQTALEALTIQGTVAEDFKTDESINRVASFLLTLGIIALNSPYLEAKALFALCLVVPDHGVDASLVSRLISRVAVSRGSSLKELMHRHLPYLVTQWLQHNHDIADFPVSILEYTSKEDFLNENRNVLLPVLFECNQNDNTDLLAQSLGRNVSELLQTNFPKLMAHIFPYIAAECDEVFLSQLSKVKIQAAKRQYVLLKKTLGEGNFINMIEKHVGDMMLSLVKLVHNPQPMVEEEVIVEPNPPHFPPAVIDSTLKFLGERFGEDCPLVAVLASRKVELHKVLQGVLEYLAGSTDLYTFRLALSSVAAVVRSILPHLKEKLKSVSAYIIRILVHCLTCYTSSILEKAPYLADYCNSILQTVCCCALQHCPGSFISVIPSLFARLLPLTKTSSAVKESAVSIIREILTTTHPDVQLAVSDLPPLPDDEEFQSLDTLREFHIQLKASHRGNLSLHDETENFLSQSLGQIKPHSVLHLLTMLQVHRVRIGELYRTGGLNQESVGHQLTYRLITLASGSDEQVALQASRCLGELGPISLGSPVFYIEDENSKFVMIGTSDSDIYCKIIAMLNRYLTSEDNNVVQAAGSALQEVLSTRYGYNAFHKLSATVKEELILLLPNSKPKAKSTSFSGVDGNSYKALVGNSDLWFCGSKYEEWVTHLACELIQAGCGSEVITQVLPVCKVKPEFSAFMLPFIIHSALRTDHSNRREILSKQFSKFFEHHVEVIKPAVDTRVGGIDMCIDKAALQVLLNVINYLRAQTPDKAFTDRNKVTPWERNFWLQVNYLQVAQAAHYCGAHFSALLFLHIHCEILQSEVQKTQNGKNSSVNRQIPPLMQISHLPEAVTISQLMLKVYSSLSDGVEGCVKCSRLIDSSARALRCQHRGQWMEAFAIHDAANSTFGMVKGLRELGFFNTLSIYIQGVSLKFSQEVSEARCEAAWRLSQWESTEFDGKSSEDETEDGVNFHHHMLHALQSLHYQDFGSLQQQTHQARQGVIRQLKLSRAESSSSIYPVLSQLQILSELEAASECLNDINFPNKFNTSIQNLEHRWMSKKTLATVEYKYKELILAARVSTLRSLTPRDKEGHINRILHTTLITKSFLSRQNRKLGSSFGSESALLSASRLNVPQNLAWKTRLEEAEVAKFHGDIQHSSQVLNSLVEEIQQVAPHVEESKIMCRVLNLYGCVLMDSRTKPPQTVFQDYFQRAVDILQTCNRDVEANKVLENSYHLWATFGNKLYQEVHKLLESDTIQTKKDNIMRSREESSRVRSLLEKINEEKEAKELSKKLSILERNIKIDCNVLQELEKQKDVYLYLAMKNYFQCLLMSSKHNMHIYRLVGLWLENSNEEKINELVFDNCSKMKSYQFVPLLYQLVARLSCQKNQQHSFPKVIFHVLERMCQEHPHHCLPVIIAQAHAHADDELVRIGSKSKKQENQVVEEDRVQAAKMLVHRLSTSAIADNIIEFQKVSLAYISLAAWCDKGTKCPAGNKVKIPSNQILVKLQNLKYTAALTRPLQLQPSTIYTPSLIVGWENICTFVGGINAPKRLTLRTSDGLKQYELLKGNDDIRQDAVMEQVFGIVNELLAKNSETRERALSMRTYQVVPLSQKSGLIQWCDNTQVRANQLFTIWKTYAHPYSLQASYCYPR
ncbi:serine-protein kinase ATM-like [Homarus americanus]|uniref:serine-protein kinase ATM-like n=1 Tax=Homarus americanus TaxID=6706 RepID=UPI001C48B1A0|nr:serine-protein kinase ATM-like [Homarus americanus]